MGLRFFRLQYPPRLTQDTIRRAHPFLSDASADKGGVRRGR